MSVPTKQVRGAAITKRSPATASKGCWAKPSTSNTAVAKRSRWDAAKGPTKTIRYGHRSLRGSERTGAPIAALTCARSRVWRRARLSPRLAAPTFLSAQKGLSANECRFTSKPRDRSAAGAAAMVTLWLPSSRATETRVVRSSSLCRELCQTRQMSTTDLLQ